MAAWNRKPTQHSPAWVHLISSVHVITSLNSPTVSGQPSSATSSHGAHAFLGPDTPSRFPVITSFPCPKIARRNLKWSSCHVTGPAKQERGRFGGNDWEWSRAREAVCGLRGSVVSVGHWLYRCLDFATSEFSFFSEAEEDFRRCKVNFESQALFLF